MRKLEIVYCHELGISIQKSKKMDERELGIWERRAEYFRPKKQGDIWRRGTNKKLFEVPCLVLNFNRNENLRKRYDRKLSRWTEK